MYAKLIGKFITQQVAVAIAESSREYEKKIKKLEKCRKDKVSGESSQKNGTRGGVRASKKNKSSKTQTTTKSCHPQKSGYRSAPKRNGILRRPLQGRSQQAGAANSGTSEKRGKKSELQERIEVDTADLENRWCQIVQSFQEKVRESYGSLSEERQSANNNALVIVTTSEKWFYFCQPTNLTFHDLMIGKVAPRALQSVLGLGVNFCSTPLHPTLHIDKSMERFDTDHHIRSIFVSSEELIPLANLKIYVRSKWKQPA